MYQQITCVGNIGGDAELTYTQQGVAVSKFSLAVGKVTGKGEERKEKTTWFRVTLWRDKAENLTQYLKKGTKVLVVGEIDASAYMNKAGEAAASLELTANHITLLSSKPTGSENGTDPGKQPVSEASAEEFPF